MAFYGFLLEGSIWVKSCLEIQIARSFEIPVGKMHMHIEVYIYSSTGSTRLLKCIIEMQL